MPFSSELLNEKKKGRGGERQRKALTIEEGFFAYVCTYVMCMVYARKEGKKKIQENTKHRKENDSPDDRVEPAA